jgi:uracil-DNA glycosylase
MEFSPSFPDPFDGKAHLMVLGEAPGAKEEKEGQPFVGTSGKLLMQVMEECGFTRKNLYISNVFWQRPPDNDVGYFFCSTRSNEAKSTKYPKLKSSFLKKEWEEQLERLEHELELLKPDVILMLGSIPLWALTGNDQISQCRGKYYRLTKHIKYDGGVAVSTFHPSYILRNRSMIETLKEDILLAKELLDLPF